MKCAVFCSKGLGDGLLFLIISNNLNNNGLSVTTYHNSLNELSWFKNLEIKKYPSEKDLEKTLSSYDLVIVNTDSSLVNIEIQRILKKLGKKSYFLHATTCKGKNLPGNYRLDPSETMVDNLVRFCEKELLIKNIKRENGISVPEGLIYRKHQKRIVIHPTSASKERNYPIEKFVKLAKRLQLDGFSISFLASKEEQEELKWVKKEGISLPLLANLEDLSTYIYESAFFLGNDSGLGHLASCLKIPTFTVFSSRRKQKFWKPDWYISASVAPSALVPNIKGLRLRDKYWNFWIQESFVYKNFSKFIYNNK